MILHLTEVSSEPLHLQIRRQVRALILAGDLKEGAALPSIRGLARQERVSVITVQRSYDDLEKEGLIQALRGKGFFVNDISSQRKVSMAEERLQNALGSALELARSEGLTNEQIQGVFRDVLEAPPGNSTQEENAVNESAGAAEEYVS